MYVCLCMYMRVLWTTSKQCSSYLFPRVATRGGRPERTRYIIGMSCKRGSSDNGVWNSPHCPVGHALQRFVEEEGGECDGCGAAVHAGDTVMDCRTCDWYLCGKCGPESNILHRALIACLTDADVEPAVRRAVMTMHHHSPDAAEAKNLDYLRAKLREAAYDREDEVFYIAKGNCWIWAGIRR